MVIKMNNYQEFYFLKNWQRLLVLSMIVGFISIIRVLFLGQNGSIIVLLIGVLLAIWFVIVMFKNRKIVINDDFVSFENHFLGFKQQHFDKNDIQVLQQKQFGLTKIEIKTNQNSIGLYPFFWGNKNGYHLIGFF